MNLSVLAGKRVLVCEDETLVAILLEEILADHACVTVGPYTTVDQALPAAQELEIDIAVLDVNLRGKNIYPVAQVLEMRRIPFFLLSGYGQGALPVDRPDWKACGKPFEEAEFVRMLTDGLGSSAGAAPR